MSAPIDPRKRTSPYLGCRNYDGSDAEWFFGRRREREMVIANLFNSRSRLLIYYGASGVGKTSLLLADVVPVLTGKKRPQEVTEADRKRYDAAVVVVFRRWQDEAFHRALREEILASVLEKVNRTGKTGVMIDAAALRKKIATAIAAGDDATAVPSGASEDEVRAFLLEKTPLPEFVAACCRVGGRMFLIFDQFEEFFRYLPGSRGREQFDADFATMVNSPEIPVTILVSLREDGLSKLDRLQLRIPNLFENMLRLQHLDEQGAREAIQVPLELFNARRRAAAATAGQPPPADIVFSKKLVEQLAREVAPPRGTADFAPGAPSLPTGRYRGASYLQILLASAWREVEQHGKTELGVESLIEAARNYGRSAQAGDAAVAREESMDFSICAQRIAASYVFCIMETELDAAAAKMTPENQARIAAAGLPRQRDVVARILRYLVTPGGAKMAHTVDTLANWANGSVEDVEGGERTLRTEEIDLALRLLSAVGLVRRAESGGASANTHYEIAHDVLADPLNKWREAHERTRSAARAAEKAKAAEKIRFRHILKASAVVLIVLGALGYFFLQSRLDSAAFRQAQYVRSADAALHLVETRDDLEIAKIVALNAIPTVSEAENMLAPPQGLVALRFATLFGAQDLSRQPPDWLSKQLTLLDSYLPSLLSPDKKWLVTLEGREPHVWNTEQLYKRHGKLPAVEQTITGMGFTTDSKTFFVTCSDGSLVEWQMESHTKRTLPVDRLEDRNTPFVKIFPKDPSAIAYPAYSAVTVKWTQDALPSVRALDAEVRSHLPAGTQTDRLPIEEILQSFQHPGAQRVSAREEFKRATKNLAVIGDATAEALVLEGIALRLLREGNELAGNGDTEAAQQKYREAMQANPNLNLQPGEEAARWHNVSLYQKAVSLGYAAAAQRDLEGAIQQFERARTLRPQDWGDRDPLAEAQRAIPADRSSPAP